jgi:hypothetical protein
MPASKAQRAATARRRQQAIALRLAGASLDTIAAQLGYAGRAAVCVDLGRALDIALADQARDAEALRQLELMRLDRLQAATWGRAMTGDPGAVMAALRVIDRRCKLLGLDAPQRHEIITMTQIEAEIARLEATLAADAIIAAPADPPSGG